MTNTTPKVLLLGCGDLGSGVAHALHRAGVPVVAVELATPLAVRRRVAFAEAVRCGTVAVEGVLARHRTLDEAAARGWQRTDVVVVTEPWRVVLERLAPDVLVDARMRKRGLEADVPRALFRVALGPGHLAGRDCDVVVETQRGAALGRVIHEGTAAPDTGVPGDVGGETQARVLRAPCAGVVHVRVPIGSAVQRGQVVASVGATDVHARIDGLLRGMLADGDHVESGQKLGDVDPRPTPPAVDEISDKARTVGEAVLRAVRARFRIAS